MGWIRFGSEENLGKVDDVAVVKLDTRGGLKLHAVMLRKGVVLGVYRVRNDGKLKSLKKWPRMVELIGYVK